MKQLTRDKVMKAKLVAPCGMNCFLCRAYRPDKPYVVTCAGGCRSDEGKARSCQSCIISNCEKLAQGGFQYCFSCDTYPCKRLKNLDKRYRGRYGMSMLANLENIRDHGIRQFIRTEKEKWTCPQCGEMIVVHKPTCLNCGYPWLEQGSSREAQG